MMRDNVRNHWLLAMTGVAVLAMPACSSKWLSGGSEEQAASGGTQTTADASEAYGTVSDREPVAGAMASDEGDQSSGVGAGASSGYGGESWGEGQSAQGQSGQDQAVQGSDQDEPVPSLTMQDRASGEQYAAIDGGSLSGFDRVAAGETPSEERIGRSAMSSHMLSSGRHDAQVAELRREEEAAIAAGFRDAFFGYNQASIEGETHDSLTANAQWIKSHPNAMIKVSGHCDERGTQDYNLVLGDKRAKAVKRYLVDLGVAPGQVTTISFGKNRPFCAEHDESCYHQNRRGHFLLREQ